MRRKQNYLLAIAAQEKSPEGPFRGRLSTLGWNQLEELCLDWLSEVRVIFVVSSL